MILSLALKKAGMSPKDIHKVPMDPATVVSAFSSGQIDAAGIWYPLIDTIKTRVPDLKEIANTRDFPATTFPTAFVAGNGVKRDPMEKVTMVLQEANDWRASHSSEAINETAKMLKLSPDKVRADATHVKTLSTAELVARTKDGTVDKWLDGLNDFFVSAGKLNSAPDPSTYYTGDLYTRVFTK
jgi:NitT/TauT family transport system substrate-binding protein